MPASISGIPTGECVDWVRNLTFKIAAMTDAVAVQVKLFGVDL